jgi:uncharacterized glyoxalase superfamily protein PhnB
MVKAIPDEYGTVTPYLVVDGAAKLIEFMQQAFGAQERARMGGPDDKIGHAELVLGDRTIMLADANPENPPTSAMVVVYVQDCDATYKKAIGAGATAVREPADQFYGDRASDVRDAFGNRWSIHTHLEDLSADEMEKRMAASMPG